jgi:hypothetical protein
VNQIMVWFKTEGIIIGEGAKTLEDKQSHDDSNRLELYCPKSSNVFCPRAILSR